MHPRLSSLALVHEAENIPYARLHANPQVLAKPSVRYRKTINTVDADGMEIAVNAQQ